MRAAFYRSVLLRAVLCLGCCCGLFSAWAQSANEKALGPDSVWILDRSIHLTNLTIGDGAQILPSPGYSVTLTVDGVETGIRPGTYRGEIDLTLTRANVVKFSETLSHNFRQALYLDRTGVVASKSVVAAAGHYSLDNGVLSNASVSSIGEDFNGIYVADGSYTLRNAKLDFTGNGGNDFAGFGAGVMSTGKNTTLVVDGADVRTHGAVRTTLVAAGGSNLVVKNSRIQALTGTLPDDYVSNVTPGEMKDAPWMLGINGNVRATNLLGNYTTATYINSDISSEGWGVLSIDQSMDTKLTAINSKISITGTSGYGTYSIGNATNSFYGSEINVADYAAIVTGGHVVYAASSKETVFRLNSELKLGLAPAELVSLTPSETHVNSKRFGVMMWGDSSVDVSTVKIMDGTIFDTAEAVFLDKGLTASIDVDGSKGAQLHSGNGIIMQLMDTDNPGVVLEAKSGLMLNKGVFHEQAQPASKLPGFDLTAVHNSDVIATFTDISLQGDFYNAIGTSSTNAGVGYMGEPGHDVAVPSGQNLVLKFENSKIQGVISASTVKHHKNTISSEDYKLLGEVTNTPCSAVNNGVIVTLKHSTWTITGVSYLTSLTLSADSTIAATNHATVVMSVNGVPTPIKPGLYDGAIVLQPQKMRSHDPAGRA